MAYQIKFEEQAGKDFDRLDNSIKIMVKKYLLKLLEREDPRSLGEPLEENLAGYWKYRVGDYRIVVEIQDNILIILILVIAKRSNVYKIADKRIN